MSDAVVIPSGDLPPAPAAPAAPALPPEIAYLKEHGLEAEAGSLQSELESLLQSRGDPVAPSPAPAPVTPTPAPVPVRQPEAAKTAQEKALDPYAVDGGDDESPVVIDDQGRARDAATGKYVPLKALHKERDLHKQTRSEMQTLREQNARVEERLAILNEILSNDEKPAAPTPAPADERPVLENPVDPEVDIFAWAKQQQDYAKQQADYIKKLEDKLNGTETLTRQQIEAMQADQAIRSDVTGFYSKNPDFLKAYNHLRDTRDRALQVLGFGDKAARDAQIAREERGLAMEALKNKRSYAETIYNLAKSYGYSGVQPEAPAPVVAPTPEPSEPEAKRPAVDPAAAAKVEALRVAKEQASPTLNGAGGSAAEGLTVAQLANMSETDFLNLAGKLGKAKLDALLRGT